MLTLVHKYVEALEITRRLKLMTPEQIATLCTKCVLLGCELEHIGNNYYRTKYRGVIVDRGTHRIGTARAYMAFVIAYGVKLEET